MSISEARAALPEVLDRVLAGEEVTITRHGMAVAVIVRPDTLRTRRADAAMATAASVRDIVDRGRWTPLRPRPKLSEARADTLVADIRAARSKR
jgi:antitoxin (DNA-binding transcriptional repressor) of toxin-antitoxin stability system